MTGLEAFGSDPAAMMLSAAATLIGLAETAAWTGFLVFLRVGGAMALLPAFGEQTLPPRIRLGLSLALTAVVAPAIDAGPAPDSPAAVLGAILAEAAAGVALGAGLRLFVAALQTAGVIAAQATSLAQIFGSTGPEPMPAIAQLLIVAGLASAITLGLHLRVVEYLILSYSVMPPGRPPSVGDIAAWGLAGVARSFALGFSLAAPFVIGAFLYNIALGVINRAMPQLMVTFVGAPALTLGGLALLALAAPVLLSVWLSAFAGFAADPFGAR